MRDASPTTLASYSPRLAPQATRLAEIGAHLDAALDAQAFALYQQEQPPATRRAQASDIALFTRYLRDVLAAPPPGDLYHDPFAWAGVSHGIVQTFVQWLIVQGYTVSTIRRTLSTIRNYARLAMHAGGLTESVQRRIQDLRSISQRAAGAIDAHRERTRVGSKKATPTIIPDALGVSLIFGWPATRAGAQMGVVFGLLLELGPRISEIARLRAGDFDLDRGVVHLYRAKTRTTDNLLLPEALTAQLRAYLALLPDDATASIWPRLTPTDGWKRDADGALRYATTRDLAYDVAKAGESVGLEHLSPHDCRHHWLTDLLERGVDIAAVQRAGGWASPAMALKYLNAQAIANMGLVQRDTPETFSRKGATLTLGTPRQARSFPAWLTGQLWRDDAFGDCARAVRASPTRLPYTLAREDDLRAALADLGTGDFAPLAPALWSAWQDYQHGTEPPPAPTASPAHD